MSDPSMPTGTDIEPGRDPRRGGPVAFGALLVAIGFVLLLAQVGALPEGWHTSIWPILLIAFGTVRLLQVTRHGREGLFFVVAGAWWLAGINRWLSLSATWPVLIVGLGASIVLQAMTTPPRDGSHPFGKRHAGAAPWILLAILFGALFSNGRYQALSPALTPNDGASVVTVAGHGERDVQGRAAKKSEVVAVMGRSVLDLSEATVDPGETITVNVMTLMGRSTIRVPQHWTVDIQAVAAAGSVRDIREYLRKADAPDPGASFDGSAPRVVVEGMVMMGSLLITS